MHAVFAARSGEGMEGNVISLDELLLTSDVVSLHVPLTRDTRHLINRRTLVRMKRSAYLINTSRGPVVDEAALAWALEERLIAGAGLDVYEDEPHVHPTRDPDRDGNVGRSQRDRGAERPTAGDADFLRPVG